MTIPEKILAIMRGKENNLYSRDEIVEAVVTAFPGTNRGSIMPSDFCYNKTNKGNYLEFPFPLFEYVNGKYKYLGLGFSYNGNAYWKDVLIGVWANGVYNKL